MIDASFAVPLVIEERHSAWARNLLTRDGGALVPALFWTECANALWRMQRAPRQGQPRIDADAAFAALRAFGFDTQRFDPDVSAVALALAVRLDHPVYDCLYLALALDRDTALATADLRFAAAIARSGALPPERLLTPG